MRNDDRIRDEKYDINREAAKISGLSPAKVDKHEYLTGEIKLPFNQRKIIEQAKLAYSPLGTAFEKQPEEQVGAINSINISNKKDELKQIEDIFPQDLMNDLICAKLK